MKKIILLSVMAFFGFQSANATNWTYQSANNKILSIEKELLACSPSPDEAGECYEKAIGEYDQLIGAVRSQNAKKVDARLWYSINLGFKKHGDSCRSDQNISPERLFFYPYQDCLTNNFHSFAVTAVELHLK